MLITKKILANQISEYLQHRLSLEQLIDWAELVMLDGEFEPRDILILREITATLGLADVRVLV